MPLVHIRVVELKCNESRNFVNYFFVNFHTNTKPIVTQKLSIDICQKNSKVLSSCSKSITLNVDNFTQNQLHINLKRHRMIISDDDVGKVVIPLKWFPRRKVVREWFPLTSGGKLRKTLMDNINQTSSHGKTTNRNTQNNDGSENLMLLLDIHLAKKKDKPFMAPFSSMKVLPSWKRPLLLQQSQFPPVPPVAYIVGRVPETTKDTNIPPHQSFVILLPPEQNQQNTNNSNNNNNQTINNINPYIHTTNNQNDNNNNNSINYSQHDNLMPQQTSLSPSSQPSEPGIQSELEPYFPAPQPNVCSPTENLMLPPFMQGNAEPMHVPLITEYMSPYSNPTNMDQIFATDDVPNVYYPQVNIIDEEDENDDDDSKIDDYDYDNNDNDNDDDDVIEEEEEEGALKNDNDN